MPPRKKQPTPPAIEQAIEPVIEPDEMEEDDPVQEDTVTFKRSHFYSVLTVLAFAAGVLLGYVAWGLDTPTAATPQTAGQSSVPVVEAPATQEPQYTRYDIPTENAYSLGPADAPITLVEVLPQRCSLGEHLPDGQPIRAERQVAIADERHRLADLDQLAAQLAGRMKYGEVVRGEVP